MSSENITSRRGGHLALSLEQDSLMGTFRGKMFKRTCQVICGFLLRPCSLPEARCLAHAGNYRDQIHSAAVVRAGY